jgi:hypothetical protein
MRLDNHESLGEQTAQLLSLLRLDLLLAASSRPHRHVLQAAFGLRLSQTTQVLRRHVERRRQFLLHDFPVVGQAEDDRIAGEHVLGTEAADERAIDVDHGHVAVFLDAPVATEPGDPESGREVAHVRER